MRFASSRGAAWLGTAVVLLHEIPLVLHGVAHSQLAIYLETVLANLFVLVVIVCGAHRGGVSAVVRPHAHGCLVIILVDGGFDRVRGL